MRFVAQHPAHPWWAICVALIEELAGENLGTGAPKREEYAGLAAGRFEIVTPPAMLGSTANLIEVGDGVADVGVTTPTAAAFMARAGTGPFARPYEGLRAIAAYPHDDFLIFLADTRFGVRSLAEFLRSSAPLRIVTGRRSVGDLDDVLTYCVGEIMREHGAGFEDIDKRDSSAMLFAGPTRGAGNLLLRGEADALFHEAQGNPMWGRVASQRDMVALTLAPAVMEDVGTRLRLRARTIPAGHQIGNSEPVPTLDFSGWLVFVDEQMPEEDAYALAMACDRTRKAVEDVVTDEAVEKPIEAVSMFGETIIPLHRGAERYAVERGYVTAAG